MTDEAGLEAELRARVRGEVRMDAGARAMYSTDSSNYRQVPLGVVCPVDADDVAAALEVARRWEAAVLARGAGTSLAGQACNRALVLDCSAAMAGVVEVDPGRRLARVLPGTILDHLRREAERHHLTFGPDPATHDRCTLGGMIGNNSCGVHSIIAGRTVDNVRSLDVITYDGLRLRVGPTSDEELASIVAAGGRRGQIYSALRELAGRHEGLIRERFPDIPRRVSGYNLDELLPERGFNVARALVGTEGTCATVVGAELDLVVSPPHRCLVVVGYPDVVAAADAVPAVMAGGPIGLEGFDDRLVAYERAARVDLAALDALPPGGGWLLAETAGETPEEALGAARRLASAAGLGGAAIVVSDRAQAAALWGLREKALGVTTFPPGEAPRWGGWEDAAVAPERLGEYLRALRRLEAAHGYRSSVYGHFGHGCLHTRFDFDLSSAGGIARFRAFMEEAADLAVSLGGSLSGEHGDGQARAELLPRMFGDELVSAFAQFKAIWDPDGRMNPGKVVAPARMDENLRLGAGYRPVAVKTHFSYPHDGGRFNRAALRCVGVGKCRREEGGAMCPSYLVTRREQDSTRGRARLLFEMLQSDVVTAGWRSKAVADALDLCLSCKSCRSECPVNVDMATYKAEFLAHHYRHRLRPKSHYSMGWLPALSLLVARSRSAGLVNAMVRTPGLGRLVKAAGGIAPERGIPRFARRPFSGGRETGSPGAAGSTRPGRDEVLLWPDTFTNHFHPEVGHAAVRVLESAGFTVRLPERPACCGLTWISTGQLGVARRVLARTLDTLAPALSAGLPVVVLEPSCAAVFRTDGPELLGSDEAAHRLAAQTMTLAELLASRAPEWAPPRREGRALLQYHCHHRAVLGTGPDEDLLARAGLEVDLVPPSCCGLAGNFGFEASHYELSMAVARRDLLPAVAASGPATSVVADGFSCRTQIEQATGRQVRHLAEVLDPG